MVDALRASKTYVGMYYQPMQTLHLPQHILEQRLRRWTGSASARWRICSDEWNDLRPQVDSKDTELLAAAHSRPFTSGRGKGCFLYCHECPETAHLLQRAAGQLNTPGNFIQSVSRHRPAAPLLRVTP
jgi:hypothetical protein